MRHQFKTEDDVVSITCQLCAFKLKHMFQWKVQISSMFLCGLEKHEMQQTTHLDPE